MKISRLLTIFLLLLVVVAWAGVIPVQAHAMLMRSIPDANAALASAPAQIELFFSEAIAAKLSKITVMDSTGKPLNSAGVNIDAANPEHLVAPLPPLKRWGLHGGVERHFRHRRARDHRIVSIYRG